MSEQERIMNVALLLWGGCFCLTAAFCLSMGNDHNREKRNWLLWMELSAAALLCCDAAAWFVQGTPGEASHLIMVATNFVVILLDVSREDFARKTEQLRRQMQENGVDASIGGVWQASTENLENLLRLADENMYREKKRYYSQADAAQEPES